MDEGRPTRSAFGKLLRHYRLAAGLSQEALAERARMSTIGVGALERGDRRTPYRETVASLAQALGLQPSDRAQLEASAARSPRSRGNERLDVARHNLSVPNTSFFGRERELETLRVVLEERRLLTLCGPGGVGKTRLAVETSVTILDRFTDGVWFADCAPLTDELLVLSTVATTLGLRDKAGGSIEAILSAGVRGKAMLVVLDNCEHVIDACAQMVDRLMSASRELRIIVTSREPLRVDGERIYHVEPLSFRQDAYPQKLDELSSAAQLFFDRASDAGRQLSVFKDAEIVTTICRRLDGLPLAIELAAAWARTLSPQQIANALVASLELLTTRSRGLSPRHQTLRATLVWSYNLLSEHEQVIFRRCAIFTGGWTLKAAQAVCADEAISDWHVVELLAQLVDKSLVVAVPQAVESRYHFLETTREYAIGLLHDTNEFARIATRHAEYYVSLAERADSAYGTLPTHLWLAPLKTELDNFRAALNFALDADSHSVLASNLAGPLHWVWFHLGLHAEGARWCEAALSGLDETHLGTRVEARLQLALVSCYLSVRGLQHRLAAAERAVMLYRHLAEPRKLAVALQEQAATLARGGRRDEADIIATEALAISRELGETHLIAATLRTKSFTVSFSDVTTRRALARESVSLMNSLDDDDGAAMGLIWLGEVEYQAGAYEAALNCVRTSLASYRRLKLDREITICLLNVAAYSLALELVEEARTAACEAVTLLTTAGAELGGGTTTALEHLAAVAAKRGDALRAARILGFCNARRAAVDQPRYPTEQFGYQNICGDLRAALGHNKLADTMAEGATFSEEQAVDEALQV